MARWPQARVPNLDGVAVGESFAYCLRCPFQLSPGAAARPVCPDCGTALRIWKREFGDFDQQCDAALDADDREAHEAVQRGDAAPEEVAARRKQMRVVRE